MAEPAAPDTLGSDAVGSDTGGSDTVGTLGIDSSPGQRGAQSLVSPFVVGFAAAVGVGIAYLLLRVVVDARAMLVLLAVSLFFAIGMDPVVRMVQSWGLRRPLAVTVVFLALAAVGTGFGFAVVPPLVDQVTNFIHRLPGYLTDLENNHRIHSLDARFHVLNKVSTYVQSGDLAKTLAGRALTASTALASTVFDGLTVLILTLYFMAYLDDIVDFSHRLVPRSRREGARSVSAKITQQLGDYVAGNLLVALIAGAVTLVWLAIIGAPTPIALALVVSLLDVIPLVGAAIAAVIVTTVVAIDSVPAAIATIVFFVLYQLGENYVLVPRLFPTRVTINPAATIIGALVGATLLGVVGFLLSIPLVAVTDLVLRDVVIPRQRSRYHSCPLVRCCGVAVLLSDSGPGSATGAAVGRLLLATSGALRASR
jgi:predicted PurR-regulated permease PerM